MTVTVVEPVTEPTVHVMIAEPVATAVTCPDELAVATPVALLVHEHELVMFCVDESEYVPVAVSWSGELPTATVGFAGVTLTDCNVGGGPLAAALKVAMRPTHPPLELWVKVAEYVPTAETIISSDMLHPAVCRTVKPVLPAMTQWSTAA